MLSDLKRNIDLISRERNIDRSLLIGAIEEAVQTAVRKKYGSRRDIEVRYNEEHGEVEIFQFRVVVEEASDDQTEIGLDDARVLDPEVQIGDELGEKMPNVAGLGRIAAQSAKQVIIHKMKDAEREVVYNMYKDQVGSLVDGIVQRFERGSMVVNLGRTDAILPRDQQIPRRSFKQGDRVSAYLQEVRQTSRDSQLILSRTCNEFLVKLFEREVPEMKEGIVQIISVAREPGFRAKIAVRSSESDVDPVGACVGMKGARVQNVVQALQGERIDIVTWSPDPAKYAYNALAPAHVTMVRADEDNKSLLVVVPNDHLSLAIGRQGQNVRLASRLMGWDIDVKSEQRYKNLQDPGYQSLLKLPNMEENLADQLFSKGITSTVVLAEKSVEDLVIYRSIDDDYAALLLAEAARIPVEGAASAADDDRETADDSADDAEETVETAEPGDVESAEVGAPEAEERKEQDPE